MCKRGKKKTKLKYFFDVNQLIKTWEKAKINKSIYIYNIAIKI